MSAFLEHDGCFIGTAVLDLMQYIQKQGSWHVPPFLCHQVLVLACGCSLKHKLSGLEVRLLETILSLSLSAPASGQFML